MTGIICSIAGATYAAAARTAKTVTAGGNAQVDTAQSQFGGASVLFDGTSDYLSVSAGGFNVGANDITIEFWVRHAAINDQQVYCDFRTGTNNHFIFYVRSDNKLELYDGGSTYTSVVTMAANTWYHLAISRSGTSLKVYRDGTEVMSAVNSRNLSDNSSIAIGSSYEFFSTNSVNGHMDEFRVSSTARYTAGFTPSTTPFTNDSNTLLLLHCNGTDATTVFTDDIGTNAIPRTPKTVTANGNAQVDTAQSKFGGASALFDGTTDGLSVDNSDFAFGTGDFTYECFVRVADTNAFMLFDGTTPTGSSNAVSVWAQLGALYVYSGGWTYQGVGTINNNTWYHVAVSRSSSNIRVFVDGTQVGSTQAFSINFTQNILHMGKARVDAGYDGNGHMDEIRVSNSARYTANFTAPTAAFTNDRNTLLLLHCNGTDASTTFTDDNVNP